MNFDQHRAHRWPSPRALVVSTVDPAPISTSVDLVARYAGEASKWIGILSVYDNLLPFLAGPYTLLPHFDMQLISDEENRRAEGSVA